jgi:DNA invertase Pin-like site-specific DNA recombinase
MAHSKRTSTNTKAAIAYYRVSTKRQGESGLGLEAQRAAVLAYAAAHGMQIEGEYTEVETGTSKRQRTEIFRAINEAKRTGGTLLIAKLDRLARNVHFVSGLMDAKVRFVACDMPDANDLTIHIIAAMAEATARQISAHTKSALEAAKARGVKLGSPQNMTDEARARGAAANRAAAIRESMQAACLAQELRRNGATFRAIADQLNTNGFTTRTGKKFEAMQVKRMLDRKIEC